jgi:2-dehydro-3-deoxygalactonokinase
MITSRNGWIETPYIPVPAGAGDLASALVPLGTANGGTINFITGVTTEHLGAPDVMRGEETQIIGACTDGMGDGVFVLPGTHSKWITVEDGRIQDFFTFMTGEVFGALRKHTILGALMTDGPFSENGFRIGASAGLASGARLLHDLFSVRTLPLFEKVSPEMVQDYLSGMLIGAEIGGADTAAMAGPVTIVGRDDLADRYEIALAVAGLDSRRAREDIVARGHYAIAKAAGLVS